jgi:flagellar hook-associated protein 1 FlgK
LRTEVEQDIGNTVATINADLTNIASLNTQVAIARNTGQSSADLEDQRDKYVSDLSQQLGVSTHLNADGTLSVMTQPGASGGSRPLVTGGTATALGFNAQGIVAATDAYAGPPAPAAGFKPTQQGVTMPFATAAGSTTVDITGELATGKLAGLFQLRDQILPQAEGQVDELAARLADDFQNLGPAPAQNLQLFIDGPAQAGSSFVYSAANVVGFAGRIQLNNTPALGDVVDNPWRLRDGTAVAAQSALTGDPTTVNAVLNLFESNQTFAAGTGLPTSATFEGYANGFTGFQADQVATNQDRLTNAKSLSDALTQRLQNQSGVNVDDELANMIQLQNAYSASARVIDTAKQMFDTLLAMGTGT